MPRSRRKRSKVVILDSRIWVKSTDIKAYRSAKLKSQKGRCAITGVKLSEDAVLDHCHYRKDNSTFQEDGRCRGVIASSVNLLEGRFLKLFQKSRIEEKYGICFEDFLIKLGEYLKEDNSSEKFHYKYMDDFRKVVKRWGKVKLLERLQSDFNLKPSSDTLVADLVQIYLQAWVRKVEESF